MRELLASGQDRMGDPASEPSATATIQCTAATAHEVGALQERPSMPQNPGANTVRDQAVGIVMALGRLPADQARTVLTEVSQRTNVTLLRIAGLLTDWASRGELNLGIRIALEEAIRAQGRAARPAGPVTD
ncbi:ANTAR domain-containing protein [Streptomyces sp. NBC_00638]|uniref:ANTAR domain-containing protein n=1 Tax=unclassified Streptomyces TaxID=2593676 RepID=UPI00225A347C|nr:ANTAR domain-containing protein [Streptomyces sp. NBC_00638]MCX5008561.1 ANTAR domain-containing protein [Streptomyces sp. NBC_00638]